MEELLKAAGRLGQDLRDAPAGILDAVLMLPLEFVYIWNATTDVRISTCILPCGHGSGGFRLNGATSRSRQPGDEVTVVSSRRVEISALARDGFAMSPRVLECPHGARPPHDRDRSAGCPFEEDPEAPEVS